MLMNTTQPLFTVATITYNSGKWVKQTIESVLASSFTDFEFLISDDCSTDDTWAIIQQYNDPRIRAWRNETNMGEYPNRNKVLNEAKGAYILHVDGDDILFKNALFEYSRFVRSFPKAAAIWGVYGVDFVVFPYMFSHYEITSLNYLSTYPISIVGFTETVFRVKELREIGGFDNRFSLGDTFIKKKFSCYYNVLVIAAGHSFWRQHPQQASNRVRSFYKNLIESYHIDKELLGAEFFPLNGKELEIARMNFRIKSVKLLILNTIRKGNIIDFFKLMKTLSIPYSDLLLVFKKGNYYYKAGANSSSPLVNDYNFVR